MSSTPTRRSIRLAEKRENTPQKPQLKETSPRKERVVKHAWEMSGENDKKYPRWLLPSSIIVFSLTAMLFLHLMINGSEDSPDQKVDHTVIGVANTNWCEKNYAVTPYIAEFYNTISSLYFMLISLYAIYSNYKYEGRFLMNFVCLAVVGLGSALFHGTLLYIWQLADELPMVWSNSFFIYSIITIEDPVGSRRVNLLIGLTIFTIVLTAWQLLNPEKHLFFLISYAIGLLTVIYLSFQLQYKYFKTILPEMSLLMYFTGLFFWILERKFCSHVQVFQFHAFWHIMAGSGTWCTLLFYIYTRQIILKKKPKLIDPYPITYVEIVVKE